MLGHKYYLNKTYLKREIFQALTQEQFMKKMKGEIRDSAVKRGKGGLSSMSPRGIKETKALNAPREQGRPKTKVVSRKKINKVDGIQ